MSSTSHAPDISNTSRSASKTNYNKWYVEPRLQFVNQTKNPKESLKVLKDDKYIYKNLRNEEFWNWKHPF